MAFELPSRFSPMDTLEKKPTERAVDYVRRIYDYCWHRSRVYEEHEKVVPSYISALVVHCLPDYEPYATFKIIYHDLYLPNGVPNYVKYGDHVTGQWTPTWRQLGDELTTILVHHHNYVNAPAPPVYYDTDVNGGTSVSSALDGTHSGWYHSDDDYDDGNSGANVGGPANVGEQANVVEPVVGDNDMLDSSSESEAPNPDPVIPVHADASSDSEMVDDDPEEDPEENSDTDADDIDSDPEEDSDTDEDDMDRDPEFTPETYKVSRDKKDNVNS